MPNRHYPPAYLRYLKARLLNLTRPSIWGTAIFLSVIGLVIREYWYNPNLFIYNQDEEVTALEGDNSAISAEDKAVAADIDNLPVLFKDLEQGNLPIIVNLPPAKSQPKNNNNLLKEVNKKQSSNSAGLNPAAGTFNSTSALPGQNPFISEAKNLLQPGGVNIGNQFLGINSLGTSLQPTGTTATSYLSGVGVNQTDNSQNNDSGSFLPTPLNQSSNQTLPSLNGETVNPINALGQTSSVGVMPIQPNNSLPRTGLNSPTGIQATVAVPNNLPPNSFNNVNNIQGLPNPVQPTTLTPPVSYGMPTGVQTNMEPYSTIQPPIPNPHNFTQISPVVADQNGNLIWRSPSQQMPSNSLNSPPTSGQNTRTIRNNNLRNLGF
ncbi:hypothetical protein [Nodularia sp. UHCC 0506]|uniref:hypothetical protein n=1 Tax=Nodularia sp. UHCC 0506 TaxID=3110243 RepID=UPI002B1F61C1|nr:hypothetical protein [Nodularia sp. UHCC 0506]MEA5515573.1 hypothetical protein [Nodularia sp. UHCC 0506]